MQFLARAEKESIKARKNLIISGKIFIFSRPSLERIAKASALADHRSLPKIEYARATQTPLRNSIDDNETQPTERNIKMQPFFPEHSSGPFQNSAISRTRMSSGISASFYLILSASFIFSWQHVFEFLEIFWILNSFVSLQLLKNEPKWCQNGTKMDWKTVWIQLKVNLKWDLKRSVKNSPNLELFCTMTRAFNLFCWRLNLCKNDMQNRPSYAQLDLAQIKLRNFACHLILIDLSSCFKRIEIVKFSFPISTLA